MRSLAVGRGRTHVRTNVYTIDINKVLGRGSFTHALIIPSLMIFLGRGSKTFALRISFFFTPLCGIHSEGGKGWGVGAHPKNFVRHFVIACTHECTKKRYATIFNADSVRKRPKAYEEASN